MSPIPNEDGGRSTNLSWRRMLVLSTAHLSPAAVRVLDSPDVSPWTIANMRDEGLCRSKSSAGEGFAHHWVESGGGAILCFPHDHGWFVHVDEDADPDHLPADFRELLMWAAGQGADWISFDGDQTPIEELPTFEEKETTDA